MKNFLKLISNKKIFVRVILLVVLNCFLLVSSYAWFHDEDLLTGTTLTLGRIEHGIIQYDEVGDVISIIDENGSTVNQGGTLSLINEGNLSNSYRNSKYISIENIGTLD